MNILPITTPAPIVITERSSWRPVRQRPQGLFLTAAELLIRPLPITGQQAAADGST